MPQTWAIWNGSDNFQQCEQGKVIHSKNIGRVKHGNHISCLSMINVPEAFGLLSKVWSYLPGAYIGSWTFTEYRLIHIFGKFFNNLQMAPVFWMIALMIFIAIVRGSYKQYQVKGK